MKRKNGTDILKEINNMTQEQLIDYREKNRQFVEKVEKRKIKNIISRIIKRIIDIIAGIIGIILLIPITIIVTIMNIANKDFGNVFYTQYRIGKNGKKFKMVKFRSMQKDADQILEKYLKENPKEAKEYKINKKLKNDPRVTKTGKFLRKTSLDEWPQFLSILTGKMSLVGPRPYLLSEKEEMGEYYKYIIKSKPGLTGLWQVSGRSNLTFKDRLKLDEEYSNRQGNIRDFKILIKTFHKVFGEEGAI